MRNTARTLITTALMVAACVYAGKAQNGEGNGLQGNNQAIATVLRPPIGSVNNCNLIMTVVLSSDFGDASFTASGTGSFQTTGVSAASQPSGSTQAPQALRATAETELGTITWSLAPDAENSPTTITANQRERDFPATADIYFTPEATISSRPGITYRADREVRLHTSSLGSFLPQRDESYSVDEPITFVADDGSSGFTVELSDVVLSGEDQPAVSVLRPPIRVPQPPCNLNMNVILSGGLDGQFAAAGTARFTTTAVTGADEPAGNTQEITSLTATAETEYGTITWTLSAGDVTPTTITANQLDGDFPATADIYFRAEARLSSRPGIVYTSVNEVHLQSTNLNSFGPQVRESYTLVEPIEFQDQSGTGFTIELTDIEVTGQDEQNVLRPEIGSINTCPLLMQVVFNSGNLGTFEFSASGNASFETVSVTGEGEAAGNTQVPVSLEASADIEELGTITWSFLTVEEIEALGLERTATTITANQDDANFPATSDIYFWPVARISSRPGAVFRATREVHVQSTNLFSFGPQVDEPYELLDGDIEFVDEENGESFTISLSNIIVGGRPGGGGADDPLLSQRTEPK